MSFTLTRNHPNHLYDLLRRIGTGCSILTSTLPLIFAEGRPGVSPLPHTPCRYVITDRRGNSTFSGSNPGVNATLQRLANFGRRVW
jgi:hypothetical protein